MKIEKVWLTDTAIWIRTDEGKEACGLDGYFLITLRQRFQAA